MTCRFKKPCIIKDTTNTVLIMESGYGYHLEGDFKGEISDKIYQVDDDCEDITNEFLKSTWGVVESKEHAEFIIELADWSDIDLCGGCSANEANFFSITTDGQLYLWANTSAIPRKRVSITIPLPHKEEWPQIGDEVCWSNGSYKGVVKSVCGCYAWVRESDGEFNTLWIEGLSKPKTAQDLKIEELQAKLCELNAVDNYILAYEIVTGGVEGLSYED